VATATTQLPMPLLPANNHPFIPFCRSRA